MEENYEIKRNIATEGYYCIFKHDGEVIYADLSYIPNIDKYQ